MDQAPVAYGLHVLVAYIVAALGARSAYYEPYAVLGVAVYLPERIRGVYHREEPVAPGELRALRAVQQLSVEGPYEGYRGVLARGSLAVPPAGQRPCLAAHLLLELLKRCGRYVDNTAPAGKAQEFPAGLRAEALLFGWVYAQALCRKEALYLIRKGVPLRVVPSEDYYII